LDWSGLPSSKKISQTMSNFGSATEPIRAREAIRWRTTFHGMNMATAGLYRPRMESFRAFSSRFRAPACDVFFGNPGSWYPQFFCYNAPGRSSWSALSSSPSFRDIVL
jgi:hypothetical protein